MPADCQTDIQLIAVFEHQHSSRTGKVARVWSASEEVHPGPMNSAAGTKLYFACHLWAASDTSVNIDRLYRV